jgi:hypothetical protein
MSERLARVARGCCGSDGAAMNKLVPDVVTPLGDVIALAPNVLSVRHWDRLFGGALYGATPRVEWAALLRRSFDVDVMACATCGGRLRVLVYPSPVM